MVLLAVLLFENLLNFQQPKHEHARPMEKLFAFCIDNLRKLKNGGRRTENFLLEEHRYNGTLGEVEGGES